MSDAVPYAADAAPQPKFDVASVVVFTARLVLGVVMIYYAVAKISEPFAFLKEVHNYGILPEGVPLLTNLTAIVLPYLELVLGVALILGLLRRGAGAIIAALMVVFIIALTLRAVGIQQAEGMAFCSIRFDCGCGTGEVYICRKLLANAALLAMALVAVLARTRRYSVGAWFDQKPPAPLQSTTQ